MMSSARQEAEPEPPVVAKTETPAPVAAPPAADPQIAAMQSQVSAGCWVPLGRFLWVSPVRASPGGWSCVPVGPRGFP